MEFIIGLQPPPVTLTPNSELLELILITEKTSNITIVGGQCDGDEIVSAILFDDGDVDLRVRDANYSVDDVDTFDDTGEGNRSHCHSFKINLKTPFLKRIVMQQTCYSAPDQPHLYWRRITYLRIDGDHQCVEVGKLREPTNVPGKYVILQEEEVQGPCMITGVGMHNADILCLQIIQGIPGSSPSRFPEHLYAYGKSSVGLVKLRPEEGFQKTESAHFIGLESSDPSVMETITKLFNFMASWYSSRSSIHRMFPDLYSLIDQSITENDRNVIFSAFRLERHLKWRIHNASKGHSFDGDPFLRIKLYQVVRCLALTLERCQRIIVHKPSINCYCVAYLSGDVTNTLIASLVLFTQISLTFVLFLSIIRDDSGSSYFALKESVVVTPIIGIFSMMLVYKQMMNVAAIRRAYPGMSKHLMGLFEIFANGFLGIAVLIIQVILVAKQDNRVEYVLNSIAAIFILELDDSVVFLDDDGVTDLHRRLLMKDFMDRIKSIDDSFFQHSNYRTARNYIQLNTEKCTIEPLPKVQFTGLHDFPSNTKNNAAMSPVAITIASKSATVASDGWAEIASSDTIAHSALRPDSKIELRFTWRDQGFGNRKGRLRVRLVHALTGEDMASSPEYGIAPHEEEDIEESFDFNHGLVRNCAEGYKYVVEVVVGGGGGHALYLRDFQFKSNAAFVEKDTTDCTSVSKNSLT